MSATHSYAVMVLSRAAYAEIRQNLEDAGWQHAIRQDGYGEVLDMSGVGIMEGEEEPSDGGAEGSDQG